MNVPRGPSMVPSPLRSPSHQCRHRSHSPVFEVIYPKTSPPRKGMAIPGTTTYSVPPPLPPPRYIEDLDAGVDISWALQNEGRSSGRKAPIPVKPGSSLLGSLLRNQSVKAEDGDIDMDWDLENVVCGSHLSPRTAYPYLSPTRHPHSALSPRLPGEQPLSQKNHSHSTDAYDKHMLLKIGKSTSAFSNTTHSPNNMSSPPRLRIPDRELREFPESAQAPSTTVRNMPPLPSPIVGVQNPWVSHQTNTTAYSPIVDSASGVSSSFSVRHDKFDRFQDKSLQLDRNPPSVDIRREQQQQEDQNSAYYVDRAFHTSKALAADGESFRPILRLGTKRRALSPASETMYHEDRRSSQASSQSTEPMAGQSDFVYQPQRTASLSSTASSAHPQSSASSYLLSTTSSLTSASTLDFASLRSPAEFAAPDLPLRISTYRSDAITPSRKALDTPNTTDFKLKSVPNVVRPTASRIGPSFICSCCPKKPRRFENEKQLRQHENEKQYACAFCNNRFKNKNEAERHQNSLHLRKQSWSCAAMTTYEMAFQSSIEEEQPEMSHDICGFCGTEFSNHPRDWNERIDHLRDLHKFGECNATKKFYRADHFRQHLKHSHAGKSGKWTNILENSCQREETISEPAGLSPTASENSPAFSTSHTRSKSTILSDSGMPNSGVETADEVHQGIYTSAN